MYKIEISKNARKQLLKLDRMASKLIIKFLEQEILAINPRYLGKALNGKLKEYQRYRVGSY